MKSRRTFIKQASIALAGTALVSNKIFSMPLANERVGLQLYSVRDDMKADPSGTLKKLVDIGYKYVEHANYVDGKFYGYAPADFKRLLDDLNLDMLSGHCVMTFSKHWDDATNDVTDAWKKTVEDAATVGQKYVVSPWMDEAARTDMTLLKKFMLMFNKSGELCKAHGMKFGYHNHNFEISTKVGDETLYDYIIKNTDPNLVVQQMDIGNMYGAGGRAIEILKKYPGRFEMMHVKDEIKSAKGEMNDNYESTVLGKGVLGVKEIVDYAKQHGGTAQFIIEQESYQDITPVESVKQDLDVMKSWGY